MLAARAGLLMALAVGGTGCIKGANWPQRPALATVAAALTALFSGGLIFGTIAPEPCVHSDRAGSVKFPLMFFAQGLVAF